MEVGRIIGISVAECVGTGCAVTVTTSIAATVRMTGLGLSTNTVTGAGSTVTYFTSCNWTGLVILKSSAKIGLARRSPAAVVTNVMAFIWDNFAWV